MQIGVGWALNAVALVGFRRGNAQPMVVKSLDRGTRNPCDVNCDVQVQALSAKPNKFNGGAFSFRAGDWSHFVIVFSGLRRFLHRIPKKLIIPWFGVRIPAGPPSCVSYYQFLMRISSAACRGGLFRLPAVLAAVELLCGIRAKIARKRRIPEGKTSRETGSFRGQ